MRKFLLAAPLAAALTFGGCATTGTGGVDIIGQIQAATVLACSFLPAAKTVADILATGDPIVATVSSVATAICNAVAPMTLAKRRGGAPTVAGVTVHGRFVGARAK